ncbi:MAG TPA: hypothetical protein VH256_04435 [Thermoleophilaceae bacterium]|jgi:hypothetical protein|nr:hypothetical protein [Thermoleophilaceae bacterium]
MTFTRPSFRRGTLAAVGAVLAFALWAPNAFASCSDSPIGQSFSQWHDSRFYVSPGNGGLEAGGTGWSLSGAKVVSGNESYYLNGSSDSHSLLLMDGASATSPSFCVAQGYPTFRFMLRNTGSSQAKVRVDVVYGGSQANRVVKTAGYLTAGQSWSPSQKLSLALGSTGAMQYSSADVQIRFVPVGSGGSFQIDDLLVDPWCRA